MVLFLQPLSFLIFLFYITNFDSFKGYRVYYYTINYYIVCFLDIYSVLECKKFHLTNISYNESLIQKHWILQVKNWSE